MTYFVYTAKRKFVYMCYCKFYRKCFHLSLTVFFSTILDIKKVYRQNASDFHFEEQRWQARIDIASSNFEDNGSY